MNPAFSVLFFTVSSGAGYGFFIWLMTHQIFERSVLMNELIIGGFIGLVLVTLGLLSSTLHLANPKNAWRAFNRFRTSWLSREGVCAVLFYPLVLAYALVVWLGSPQTLSSMIGLSAAATVLACAVVVLALVTVICTSMIYASLKPIRQWHNPLTTPLYVLFSLMSGGLLFNALHYAFHNELNSRHVMTFLAIAAIAAITKFAYFIVIGKPDGATINSATSLSARSQAQVRLLDVGHTADTFLTKEFVFDAGAKKLMRLRKIMQLLAFILPMALMLVVAYFDGNEILVYLAFVSTMLGLFVERWLFFAEARHVVRLYHGDQRA